MEDLGDGYSTLQYLRREVTGLRRCSLEICDGEADF